MQPKLQAAASLNQARRRLQTTIQPYFSRDQVQTMQGIASPRFQYSRHSISGARRVHHGRADIHKACP
jgi:hypothetical protein